MHVALHTLSAGTVAHAWMCGHGCHPPAHTLWSTALHTCLLHKLFHTGMYRAHILCARLLCTWRVHTWVESIVAMHVHGFYTDTPCAKLLCRVAGHTWSTPVTAYSMYMYWAYTCMLSTNKTSLYTEFTYPVCSEVYKARTCGTHTHRNILCLQQAWLPMFCVQRHTNLCMLVQLSTHRSYVCVSPHVLWTPPVPHTRLCKHTPKTPSLPSVRGHRHTDASHNSTAHTCEMCVTNASRAWSRGPGLCHPSPERAASHLS